MRLALKEKTSTHVYSTILCSQPFHTPHPIPAPPPYSVAIDNIAAEANELLQEAGVLDTSAVCQRFSLPTDFLLKVGTLLALVKLTLR